MNQHPNPRGLDMDRLHMLPRDLIAKKAHAALTPINRLTGEEMVMAVSVLFAAIVNRCGLEPQQCHTMAMRVLREQDYHKKANDALQSLRDFAGLQVKGDTGVVIS